MRPPLHALPAIVLLAALWWSVDPVRADTLTIASYNLHNLFDVFNDPYTEDEKSRVKPREQIELLAQAIRAADADVVAMQEVENEHVLRAMVEEFLPDAGYDHIAVSGSNDSRGIRLGLLCRKPVLSVTSYRWQELPTPSPTQSRRFARDLLHARIRIAPGRDLELLVAHYKSKRDAAGDRDGETWRLAEAAQTRRIVEETTAARPGAWIAVVGDFNDTPESPPVRHLLDKPAEGEPLLEDIHAALPPGDRITYRVEPYRSTIDYILVCPAMARRLVPGSARLLSGESILGGSDHAPIVAAFRLD